MDHQRPTHYIDPTGRHRRVYGYRKRLRDYFAFQNDLNLSDILPDGLRFDANFTPVISFSGQGGTIDQRFSPSNYTVSQNFTGAIAGPPIFVLDPVGEHGTTTVTFGSRIDLSPDGSPECSVGRWNSEQQGTGAGALADHFPLPFGPTAVAITYRAVARGKSAATILLRPSSPAMPSNQAAINGSLLNISRNM